MKFAVPVSRAAHRTPSAPLRLVRRVYFAVRGEIRRVELWRRARKGGINEIYICQSTYLFKLYINNEGMQIKCRKFLLLFFFVLFNYFFQAILFI